MTDPATELRRRISAAATLAGYRGLTELAAALAGHRGLGIRSLQKIDPARTPDLDAKLKLIANHCDVPVEWLVGGFDAIWSADPVAHMSDLAALDARLQAVESTLSRRKR